jgi:hypothetical protein
MRAALLLLFLVPAVALAQAGRFLLAVGDVTLVRGSQQLRAAPGTTVEAGDLIRVGARSSVQLRMSDQSIISLRSNTEFRIDEYSFTGRGDDSDRSVFSLLKGGMRTVGGHIARPQPAGLVKTAARPEQPTGPQPTAEEKKPRDDTESKTVGVLRSVAGALTPTRHAVKVPTATIGIRGTHYTLVHCANDCFERRRTTLASLLLAQTDAPSTGLGNLAPNGTYGGISDGLVGVTNNREDKEFGANEFFYVASADSSVQSLIGPPGFLYDTLDAQDRNRGQPSKETTANMGNSGINAESRPSDPPIPPAPPQFVVTEQRNEAGALTVLSAPTATGTGFLAAFTNGNIDGTAYGAFIDVSALTTSGSGSSQTLLAFSVSNPDLGPLAGDALEPGDVINQTAAGNSLNAYWGLWMAGSATDSNGTTSIFNFSGDGANIFHYLVGPSTPPEVIAAKTGTLPYGLVGGTTPTNNIGETGTFSIRGPVVVDFVGRTVAFPDTSVTFTSQSWNFPAPSPAPITIQPGGASVASASGGTCLGNACSGSSALLHRSGIFMGPVGDHLGVAHQARTDGGSAMQTIQIFSSQTGQSLRSQ